MTSQGQTRPPRVLTDGALDVRVAAVPRRALAPGLVVDGLAEGRGGAGVLVAGVDAPAREPVARPVGGAVPVVLTSRLRSAR